ncbi:alpha/beta fold hydrolase [Clostridium sp. LIBA-8841]|uniref:alpha/beta fold hydrolase n=1 Tax=Clostridium sp. LIBA-8841 TaxID=2987530 RepID=UPI002AC758F3|nr:alpha/beta fold hydrolase [Clostridium sp. LIBA-8841]MDZ5252934.1 lysophospholipase [Clostridium sp. LIBA-8841]
MRESFAFKDSEGLELQGYKWSDGKEFKAVVHILHGMTEDAIRYDEFAERLVEEGFLVYSHDHRGHGFTAKELDSLGYIADDEGFEWMVEDAKILIENSKEKHKGYKIILFGHSMGSFISQRLVQKYNDLVDMLILSGTNGEPDKLAPIGEVIAKIESKLKGKKHKSKLMDSLIFGGFNKNFKPCRTSFDWLCSVEEEVDKYIDNERYGFICSSSFYYDLLRGLRSIHKVENMSKINKEMPIYIFAGDKDPVGNFGKGIINLRDKLKEFGVKNVQYKLYENGRHEMLNEKNKIDVMEDTIAWMLKNI